MTEGEEWHKVLLNRLKKLCLCCYQNRNEPSQVPQVFSQEHKDEGSKVRPR